MNKLMIIGNLTSDPVKKATSAGKTFTTFTVAVNSKRWNTDATYFRCTAWERAGDIISQYMHKSDKIFVSGELSAHLYDANNEKRLSLDVRVDDFEFLSKKDHAESTDAQSGFAKDNSGDVPW